MMLAAVLLISGCGADGGVRVEGPAPTVSARPAFVKSFSTMIDEPPRQKPQRLGLSEALRMDKLRWAASWGSPTVEGEGLLASGCGEGGCAKYDQKAKVVLSGLVQQESVSFYSRAEVTAPGIHEKVRLPVPPS